MTAELLILLHYFKGKAAPLLRCLPCHFLFPHFVLARAGGGSAPGWAGAPGSVPGAMAPLCPSATLGSSSPSSRCLRHPFGPPGPIWGGVSLGWDVQAGCPCRVSPGCPWLLGERWGAAWPPASSALPPIVLVAVFGQRCHRLLLPLHGSNRSAPGTSGGALPRSSPAPRIPDPPGTGRDVERSLPEISDGNSKAPGDGGMLRLLLPLRGVLCPCSSFPPVTVPVFRGPSWLPGSSRSPAGPQMCPDPSPWRGLSPLPSLVPPTPEGQKQNLEFPVPGRSPRCPGHRVTQVPPSQDCPA